MHRFVLTLQSYAVAFSEKRPCVFPGMAFFYALMLSFLLGLFLPCSVFPQVNEWPAFFLIPEYQAADTSKALLLNTDSHLYRSTFTSIENLSWSAGDSIIRTLQTAQYSFVREEFGQKHFVDLSGSVSANRFPFSRTDFGFSWTPWFVYSKNRNSTGNLISAIDVGPTFSTDVAYVPIKVNGGLAAKAWNNNVPHLFEYALLSQATSDLGFFGNINCGDYGQQLTFAPVNVGVNFYSRSMETSRLNAMVGNALYHYGTISGDSLFVYYADSLAFGRDAFLGEARGVSQYFSTLRRNERSFMISGGIKGRKRVEVVPALGYSFSQYTLEYPDALASRSDRCNQRNTFFIVCATDSTAPVIYKGGIRLEWENENKLFDNDIGNRYEKSSAYAFFFDSSNSEFLQINTNDYNAYIPSMKHSLSRYWKNGLGAEYTFETSRRSSSCPQFYLDATADTIRSNNDNDRISLHHRLDLWFPRYKIFYAGLFGEYVNNTTNYIRKEKSANNFIDSTYKIGVKILFGSEDWIFCKEEASAQVKSSHYQFPSVNTLDFPPFSRTFESLFYCSVALSERLTIGGQWKELYDDDGLWYARAYAGLTNNNQPFKEYYGIQSKTWEHRLLLFLNFSYTSGLHFETGCVFADVYSKEFSDEEQHYVLNNLGAGYLAEPYFGITFQQENGMAGKLLVKRSIDTIANDYWDLVLSVMMGF